MVAVFVVAVLIIDKQKIDDPVGAVAVHGINGLFGTIAVGLFATEEGYFWWRSLFNYPNNRSNGYAIFSFCLTYVIMTLLKKSIGIRISAEEEEQGIDLSTFGVQSYNLDD